MLCEELTLELALMLTLCETQLTYLLQSSLGGTAANGKSSRTLMMLHLSPLAAHWQESRSSLLFGSKVHGTHIGAAKKK